MIKQKIPAGVVHKLPPDVRLLLTADPVLLRAWEDITELARNEWLCWVENAKLIDTRNRRIQRIRNDLLNGKRRPCCWAGCIHRQKTARRS